MDFITDKLFALFSWNDKLFNLFSWQRQRGIIDVVQKKILKTVMANAEKCVSRSNIETQDSISFVSESGKSVKVFRKPTPDDKHASAKYGFSMIIEPNFEIKMEKLESIKKDVEYGIEGSIKNLDKVNEKTHYLCNLYVGEKVGEKKIYQILKKVSQDIKGLRVDLSVKKEEPPKITPEKRSIKLITELPKDIYKMKISYFDIPIIKPYEFEKVDNVYTPFKFEPIKHTEEDLFFASTKEELAAQMKRNQHNEMVRRRMQHDKDLKKAKEERRASEKAKSKVSRGDTYDYYFSKLNDDIKAKDATRVWEKMMKALPEYNDGLDGAILYKYLDKTFKYEADNAITLTHNERLAQALYYEFAHDKGHLGKDEIKKLYDDYTREDRSVFQPTSKGVVGAINSHVKIENIVL